MVLVRAMVMMMMRVMGDGDGDGDGDVGHDDDDYEQDDRNGDVITSADRPSPADPANAWRCCCPRDQFW